MCTARSMATFANDYALLLVVLVFCQIVPVVKADSGDLLAGMLASFIIVVGVCAAIGWYKRFVDISIAHTFSVFYFGMLH